jgi:hypothetical protein
MSDTDNKKGLKVYLWLNVGFACLIITALGVTIYRSYKSTQRYLNMVAVLSAILILSALSAITYISILFIDIALDQNRDYAKNFALETVVVCYDLVILVIAVKYLTNSIKVKLNV